MTEIWKKVKGYDGLYDISNKGRVRSWNKNGYGWRDEYKILKPDKDKGYFRVRLYKNTDWKKHSVHRLVAEHFISNPENKPCVNHIDGVKINNCVDNLEWVTRKENGRHAMETGLHHIPFGNDSPGSKLKKKEVIKIKELYNETGLTQKEIAKKYSICQQQVSNIVRNKTWTHINHNT